MKFPLILSCGHAAADGCKCSAKREYKYDDESPIDRALNEFRGNWRATLEGYGAQLPHGNKHGPCPVCGGKDRFRFDDKDGLGTWFCSHCPERSGGGLKLLSMYLGKSTIDTSKELLGDTVRSFAPVRVPVVDHNAVREANIKQAAIGAANLLASAVMRQNPYMERKGLSGEWLTNGEVMIARDGERIQVGELLLVPAYKNGELVNMQQIKEDGEKRPLYGGDMQGVYNKIDGKCDKFVGIAEGYATGQTCNRITGMMTYCAFNTGNLLEVAKYVRSQHPNAKIVFFVDHDELDDVHGWRPGEHYAEAAAIAVDGIMAIPPELGDWNDYYQKHGETKCRDALREAMRKDMYRNAPVSVAVEHEPTKNTKDLPDGISLKQYDIDNPPGLAGEITQYMRSCANRELTGGAYALAALQCMSICASGMVGMKGVGLSLISLTLGLSAGGKELPQRVVKEILHHNNKKIYGDIRSDKDVVVAAYINQGRCAYIVDEAQKILGSNTGQNKFMNNVESVIMQLCTAGSFEPSELHRTELADKFESRKATIEKRISAKQKDIDECGELDDGKRKKLELDVANLELKLAEVEKCIGFVNNCLPNPSVNLMAFSTPQKLASMIDEDKMESGFFGRAVICDCGEERGEATFSFGEYEDFNDYAADKKADPQLDYLKMQVGLICQLADDVQNTDVEGAFTGKRFKYAPTREAFEDIKAIAQHYDQQIYRNHLRMGAIYARLLERVLSLSSIMALGNIDANGHAVVERDYVRYALMLALSSIEYLYSNLKINEGVTDRRVDSQVEALTEKIRKKLTVHHRDKAQGWRYKSEIFNYIKRQKYYQAVQDECEKAGQNAFENALTAINDLERTDNGKMIRLKRSK